MLKTRLKNSNKNSQRKESKRKMKINTPNGTGKGMPLTDIQENNKLMKKLIYAIAGVGGIVGGGFLVLSLYILWQIQKWNILTNIVEACVG